MPTFLLIVAGFILRRILVKEESRWLGIEQLVYDVLFPALLADGARRHHTMPITIALVA